ncbi:MAG: hypothetical protein ACP5IZ_04560 [Thermoprotei archaeon]|jgi:hypothetical protein
MKNFVSIILVILILNTWSITLQQNIPLLNPPVSKSYASFILNPAAGSSDPQPSNLISVHLGYSRFFPFHNYTPNEIIIYDRGDNLWIFISLRNTSLSIFNISNNVIVTLINPNNEIIVNTTILANSPVNIYNFSFSDYLGYWFLVVRLPTRISEFSNTVKILLVDSAQNVSVNIKNQLLAIKQGDLTYTINGTIIFKKPISEYQALLFPIDKPINTTITGIHGERVKIIGNASTTNNIMTIDIISSLQVGFQASLSIERPIILENYYTITYLYWYPLIYETKNTTPSEHHKIIISLNNLTVNQPLWLNINLLDPKSQQSYEAHSFNLIYLRSLGIYSYTAENKVYSHPIVNATFQSDYKGYAHTLYILAVLSRTYGIWSINVVPIFPPFIKINIVDQSNKKLSNYQLSIINSSPPITTIFYEGDTYIIPKTLNKSSSIIFYYNLTIKEYDININYYTKKIEILHDQIIPTIIMKITLYKLTVNLYAWGKPLSPPSNIRIQISKFNDGKGVMSPQSYTVIFTLPPGQYNIKIFNNDINWSKNVTLDSDIQIDAELYTEDPVLTFLIIFIGIIIITGELMLGIVILRKIK